MKRLKIKVLCLVLCLSVVAAGSAVGIEFKAEKVDYDINTTESMLEDNVVITHEGKSLAADSAKININESKARAKGKVVLISQEEIYYIEDIEYNFSSQEGFGNNGISYNCPWIIEGERIEKRGEDVIITNAVLYPSTCPEPLVIFRAKKATIKNKKFLILNNITQYIGKVPVFWLPYARKNISDDRNELNFTPGKNSLYGFFLKTSYRHWFQPEVYGRAHVDILEDKGIGLGIDAGIESSSTNALLQSYYINDKDYEPIRSKDVPEDKEKRYGVNLRATHAFPESWLLTMEGNKQSDIDFYDDFYYDDFRDEIQKRNYATLSRTMNNMDLSFNVEQRFNDFFTVLEKEPEVTFDFNNYFLEEYNLFHKFSVEGARLNLLYAEDAQDSIALSRFDMYNELSYPMKFFGWLNVRPEISMENTYYSDAIEDDSIVRNVYTGEVDFFVKFYKIMYPEKAFLGNDRFRHVFEPHVTYTYRPEPNYINSEIYQLDGIDNKPELNRIKIDLRNLLQAKVSEQAPVKNLVSGSFFIYYDFLEDEFSDVGYQWDLRPLDNISIDLIGTVDKDNGDLLDTTVDLAYYHNDILGFAFGWVFRKDKNSLVSPEVFLNIQPDLFARALVRYDYEMEETEYSEVSLVKQAKGMNIALQYRKRHLRDEETVMIVFSLTDYPQTNIALR
ncbi:MAG: LPS-assembly protein LptD [Candidatus Aureabacteria bacterium]|nr:LPS-assembly protein LptD [Candidatus Auribacterota bacterium]